MSDRLEGILPVVQTALDDKGEIDHASMERQIEFCLLAGVNGLVYPVLGSEFMFLSDNERRDLVEFIVNCAAGRIPVIAGVAGASTAIAVEQAAHARAIGADAVIAMPPYVSVAAPDQILRLLSANWRRGANSRYHPAFAQGSWNEYRFS